MHTQSSADRFQHPPHHKHKSSTTRTTEFFHSMIALRRVAKTNKKGRQMHPSVMIVVGDRAGRLSCANTGAKELADGVQKAYNIAQTRLRKCHLIKRQGYCTLLYDTLFKYKATRILMRRAKPGTCIIACEVMRPIFEAVGITDVVTKVINSKSKINIAYCTVQALYSMFIPARCAKQSRYQ